RLPRWIVDQHAADQRGGGGDAPEPERRVRTRLLTVGKDAGQSLVPHARLARASPLVARGQLAHTRNRLAERLGLFRDRRARAIGGPRLRGRAIRGLERAVKAEAARA